MMYQKHEQWKKDTHQFAKDVGSSLYRGFILAIFFGLLFGLMLWLFPLLMSGPTQ